MKRITEMPIGKAAFPHGAGNPDWESAPYEESGIVIADFLKDTIAEFMKRFDAMTIKIERDENPGLFRYHLKEGVDSSSNECDCSH